MAEVGLYIFLIFIAISVIVAIRAAVKSQKRQKTKTKRYKPYQPHAQNSTTGATDTSYQYRESSERTNRESTVSESRAAYASADEYFRAGMYDRAKEEYLKTGRIFGAAKSIASKGRDWIPESLQIISRYAPEREEEMVRNLSRYFFDSGQTEISAIILYDHGLTDESDAVLATIGKSIDDIEQSEVVEVGTIEEAESESKEIEDTQRSLEELEVIASETKEEIIEEEEEPKERKATGPQPLKVATSDLEERCSVCMSSINAGDSFVRCPYCEIPSHYAHIVEWIKVKPQCPNCRRKLVARMFQV